MTGGSRPRGWSARSSSSDSAQSCSPSAGTPRPAWSTSSTLRASPRTVYWYFENKEALFRELVVANRQNLRRAQGRSIDPEATPLQQIRQGTEASLVYMADQAQFFALLEVENINRNFADVLRVGTQVHTADDAPPHRGRGSTGARSATTTRSCWPSEWWGQSATTATSIAAVG